MPAMTIEQLRSEFSTLHDAVQANINKALADNGRDLTADEQKDNDAKFARMDTIKKLIDAQTKLAGAAYAAGNVQMPTQPAGKAEHDTSVNPTITVRDRFDLRDGQQAQRFEQFKEAAKAWAATGQMNPAFAIPRNAFTTTSQTITTATENGILLPTIVGQPIVPAYVNSFREAHRLLGMNVMTTNSTADINLPVLDGQAGGAVAENDNSATDGSADNPPSLSESIKLHCSTYESGQPWFSNLDLQAVDFDLYSAILPQLEYSKELGLEAAIVAGILADTRITNIIRTVSTSALNFGNLVSLTEALPKRWQFGKVVFLSAQAHAAFAGLTTSTGQPVMTWTDPQNSSVLKIQNTPVIRSDYFENFGANKVVGAVVSLLGFRLRDAGRPNVARYVNFPGKRDQTGFDMFTYNAFGWAPSAVALLKCPASA